MSASTPSSTPTPAIAPLAERSPEPVDLVSRRPLFLLFCTASLWLLMASAFLLIASIKFHGPGFLADSPWLTYGRVFPAGINALLYGFAVPAGLGSALWIFSRLGMVAVALRGLVVLGGVIWNVGVALGIGGILAGDGTGFPLLEIPPYAAPLMLLGYLLVGLAAVFTFHRRRSPVLFPSQWFLFAAVFWFPWIYASAQLLLVFYPGRGVAQSVVAWWYANHLRLVWLGLAGLGVVFYLVPRLTGRDLQSRYLALFTFWTFLLFGGWAGIPGSAPVPAWMPVLSGAMGALLVIPMVATGLILFRTVEGRGGLLTASVPLRFVSFSAAAFIAAGLMQAADSFPPFNAIVHFTWFEYAQARLQVYGFFAMAVFGVVYLLAPRLFGVAFPWPRLVAAHFWLAALGILLVVLPLAVGGVFEGLQVRNPDVAFTDRVVRGTLMFLRLSTVGELLLAAGHVCLFVNLSSVVVTFCRLRTQAKLEVLTADLYPVREARA